MALKVIRESISNHPESLVVVSKTLFIGESLKPLWTSTCSLQQKLQKTEINFWRR